MSLALRRQGESSIHSSGTEVWTGTEVSAGTGASTCRVSWHRQRWRYPRVGSYRRVDSLTQIDCDNDSEKEEERILIKNLERHTRLAVAWRQKALKIGAKSLLAESQFDMATARGPSARRTSTENF